MTRDRRGPESLGPILRAFLDDKRRLQVEPRLRVVRAWDDLAEAQGLRGTRVAAWRESIAIIEVASPPLCAELVQFRRPELLDAMREALDAQPPLKDIRFRLGAFPTGSSRRDAENEA
jgi:Dna[CI] antecedent DciA-like protein